LSHEQFPGVERHLEAIRLVEDRLLLALREVEVDNRTLLVARAGPRQPAVEQLALDGQQVGVVARLGRQDHTAGFEAIDIDVDVRRGGRLRGLVFFLVLRVVLLVVGLRSEG
jgi:hypothetical protein